MKWLVDKALDLLWDVTLPVSGECPVCGFWRGVGIGFVAGALIGAWIAF